MDLFDVRDKVVVVTGGAGYLGTEICRGLEERGATVIPIVRDKSKCVERTCYEGDVNDVEGFERIVTEIIDKKGQIDALINNASAHRRVPWEELSKQDWLDGFEGILNHYFTCTKAVFPHMMKRNKGTIINIASLWSFIAPNPNVYPQDLPLLNPSAYVPAAKGAILQLTRHLAGQWGRHGIRVNAISPGWFPKKRGPERPDYMEAITSKVPLGRIGVPADVLGAVVFLVSDAASYITGQNIVVDGGYSVW